MLVHGGHVGPIYSVARSPNDKRLVSGSSNGVILSWDIQSRRTTITKFIGHTGAIYSLAYSPGSTRLVSGSEDRTVRIWDAETGQAIGGPLDGHTAAISSVIYSPDESRIISGSVDSTIRIWDPSSGKTVVGPLIGHGGPVYSVACSPDGTSIASGSADGTIRFWSVDTGRTIRETLTWHSQASHSLVYSTNPVRNAPLSCDDAACYWGTETCHFQLSSARQRMLSGEPLAANPIELAGLHSISDKANRIVHIQDRFIDQTLDGWLTVKYSTPKTQIDNPSQRFVLVETEPEFSPRWELTSEGGVVMNSAQWLFWLPHNARNRVLHPLTHSPIHKQNVIWLDLNATIIGDRWHQCYAPRQQNDARLIKDTLLGPDPNMPPNYKVLLAAVLAVFSFLYVYVFMMAD
ncbi:hypothetical protein FRC12_003391 [Ceratobasidium sp. 428]|nr:hypothetical protein FRC12_003391 [Ceratobasidium sp. 428]